MNKFDFSIYKQTRIYFVLFDAYLKNRSINKEMFFNKLYINYSSYRRAREYEEKVGSQILKQLCDYFEFKVPNNVIIDRIEELTNRIYHNMYYKIYTTYESDLEEIDRLLDEKYILFPILKLFKLFLHVNAKAGAIKIMKDNQELYDNVKIYKKFFTEELEEIYEILSFFFEDEIGDKEWSKSYDNALTYQLLASRYSVKKDI